MCENDLREPTGGGAVVEEGECDMDGCVTGTGGIKSLAASGTLKGEVHRISRLYCAFVPLCAPASPTHTHHAENY